VRAAAAKCLEQHRKRLKRFATSGENGARTRVAREARARARREEHESKVQQVRSHHIHSYAVANVIAARVSLGWAERENCTGLSQRRAQPKPAIRPRGPGMSAQRGGRRRPPNRPPPTPPAAGAGGSARGGATKRASSQEELDKNNEDFIRRQLEKAEQAKQRLAAKRAAVLRSEKGKLQQRPKVNRPTAKATPAEIQAGVNSQDSQNFIRRQEERQAERQRRIAAKRQAQEEKEMKHVHPQLSRRSREMTAKAANGSAKEQRAATMRRLQ
jgi:hypothetical protein